MIRVSDVGVGDESVYYEKVRNFFYTHFWLSIQDFPGIRRRGKRVGEMLDMWAESRRCYGSDRLRDDGDGV